jgi:hypothetical protein
MTMKLALLGAAALAATALVTPVQAQEVITNPGRCAQYYPNANCTNLGAGNPYTNGGFYAGQGGWQRADGWQNGYAYMRNEDWHHHRRQFHHHH